MPCFNAGQMLAPAVRSVLGQTHPDLEIIFVDNNSTDGSLEAARRIAEQTARRFVVLQCLPQGVNHARNLGYAHAAGDFIQWLDADDELAPDKIALQVAAMQADPAADIAYGDWLECRVAPDGRTQMRPHKLIQDDDQLSRTLAGVWYPPHLYLVRRAAAERLQEAEAWFPGRSVATDVEYSAVAALMGLRFRHVAGARVRYNIWSSGQISGGTPYSRRLESLAAIFRRLQAMTPGEGVRLGPGHLALLHQDWDVWAMSPAKVNLTPKRGRRSLLRRLEDGCTLELRPREAAVAEALLNAPGGMACAHLALNLAAIVTELQGDHLAAHRILHRLRSEGFMERLAQTDPPSLESA